MHNLSLFKGSDKVSLCRARQLDTVQLSTTQAVPVDRFVVVDVSALLHGKTFASVDVNFRIARQRRDTQEVWTPTLNNHALITELPRFDNKVRDILTHPECERMWASIREVETPLNADICIKEVTVAILQVIARAFATTCSYSTVVNDYEQQYAGPYVVTVKFPDDRETEIDYSSKNFACMEAQRAKENGAEYAHVHDREGNEVDIWEGSKVHLDSSGHIAFNPRIDV